MKRGTWRVGLAAAAALAAYGIASAQPAATAGVSSSKVSGFAVSGVSYDLASADPRGLDGVSFTVSPATAKTVKVRFGASGWYRCSVAGAVVSCATPGVRLDAASSLDVVASS